jgi:hypothetical protein
VPLLLAHLPHLLVALGALGLAARLEMGGGPAPRPTAAGIAVGAVLVAATVLVALPFATGGHGSRAAVELYLAAGALGALRAGWLTPRRLPLAVRARLGAGGRAGVGVAVALAVAVGYLAAGLVMTHGVLLGA